MDNEVTAGRQAIDAGTTALGIEFGSTRIKAVLTGPDHLQLAAGGHEWENQFVDQNWTYSLEAVWAGLQACFADLAADVQRTYGVPLVTVGSLGVSAMMHGYLPFGADDELLAPFRTWRNTSTGPASEELTELFNFHIPQRWSIAHLHQAVRNDEPHVGAIRFLTTLAGYVHWQLTGERVLGVGDASGMFPIDSTTGGYDAARLAAYDALVAPRGFGWRLADVLPAVLPAGAPAGRLTDEGARRLDPSGTLQAGVPLCPPEGDAGTGMVATNSVARRTGNVSAGTSIFAMAVLERALERLHPEIDLVTTPAGDPVAMVHCNNFTSDLNSWVGLFGEFAALIGAPISAGQLFETLYRHAMTGDADGGGMLAYNYLSGEHISGLEEGRPLFVRSAESRFSLANVMRTQLLASLGALRMGMDILLREENVELDSMFAHGGFFKTEGVGQALLAAAIQTPVSVGGMVGEGGAWGMALLASFAADAGGLSLSEYLTQRVFAGAESHTLAPDPEDVAGFEAFMQRYVAGLSIERAAVAGLPLGV